MSVETAQTDNQSTSVTSAMPADFYRLLKPRVMYLVIYTAIIGMLMAPGGINPFLGFISILCISIGAGASGALNMWYDADIDAVMDRTAKQCYNRKRCFICDYIPLDAATLLGFSLMALAGL